MYGNTYLLLSSTVESSKSNHVNRRETVQYAQAEQQFWNRNLFNCPGSPVLGFDGLVDSFQSMITLNAVFTDEDLGETIVERRTGPSKRFRLGLFGEFIAVVRRAWTAYAVAAVHHLLIVQKIIQLCCRMQLTHQLKQ